MNSTRASELATATEISMSAFDGDGCSGAHVGGLGDLVTQFFAGLFNEHIEVAIATHFEHLGCDLGACAC